jgi:hypothetical protein
VPDPVARVTHAHHTKTRVHGDARGQAQFSGNIDKSGACSWMLSTDYIVI